VSFDYPQGWHVTGFSMDASPRRLAVTTYPLLANAVEGDCGGHAVIGALPPTGAAVLVLDYGPRFNTDTFPLPPRPFTLRNGRSGVYECYGVSTLFRFSAHDRALQVHVAFGRKATEATRGAALAILDPITN